MKKIFSEKNIGRLVPSLIAIITFIVFLPSLDNEFLNWDDDRYFLNNPHYRGLGWEQLKWMWSSSFESHYKPITWITLGFDYVLWGMEPFGYHLTSVIFHTLNGVVFYFFTLLFFRKVFLLPVEKNQIIFYISGGIAALLFAIHPLRAESVAWVTERTDVVSGLFALLTLITYIKYCDLKNKVTNFSDKNHRSFKNYQKWHFACFLFFVLTTLSRGNNITLLAVFFLLDLYPLNRLNGSPSKWFRPDVRHILLEKIPFLFAALFAGLFAAAAVVEQYDFEMNPYSKPVDLRLAQAGFGLAFHLVKTLIPLNLAPLYQYMNFSGPILLEWNYLLSWILVFIVFMFFLYNRKKWPAGLAAFSAYVIMLSPFLGILGSSIITFDHLSYLSCLPWALLGGSGFFYILQAYKNNKIKIYIYTLTVTVTLFYLMTLGYLTWNQVQVWRNDFTLWNHAAKVLRYEVSNHYNLGVALYKEEKTEEAMAAFNTIKLYHFSEYKKIGKYLIGKNEPDIAVGFYENMIESLNFDRAYAFTGMANVKFKQGKSEEAIAYYERAIEIDPKFKEAYLKLIIVLSVTGKMKEALEQIDKALELFPDNADFYAKKGMVFVGMKKMEDAFIAYNKSLSLQPDNAEVHNNLANVLTEQGRFDEAIEHYQKALEIKPAFDLARRNIEILMRKINNKK